MNASTPWRWVWLGSLILFIVAASTGALYRFGLIYGLPAGLALGNVRHAHSHLMFLGWVTPLLMGLILRWWPRVTGQPLRFRRSFQVVIAIVLLLAALAYLPFLLYGYQTAALGTIRLPLSSMTVGLAMLSWYAFIWLYWRATRGRPRPLPVRLWDAALGFLFLASIGAWGVAVITRLGLDNPFWSLASTQLFMDTFAEGWFVLAMLGVLYASFPAVSQRPFIQHPFMQLATNGLILGLPLIFLLNLPLSVVPPSARLIASAAGLLVALGLAVHIVLLWPSVTSSYRWPLAFLGLKTAMLLVLIIPAGAQWFARANLRISYLHWLLLGFVTLSLALSARRSWGTVLAERSLRPFLIAVTALLATLIPLTGLWPAEWSGRWVHHLAAWGTLPPLVIAFIWWVNGWRSADRIQAAAEPAGEPS